MAQRFALILRSSLFCWCLGLLLAPAAHAAELAAGVSQFSTALEKASPAAQVPLQALQQLDPALLKPESMYPRFQAYSVADLSALYKFDNRCVAGPSLPESVLPFVQALCQAGIPPASWFSSHPVYPLGGSSAWHYILRHPDAAAALQNALHVRERPGSLGGVGTLSDDNLEALVGGQRWLLQNGELWHLSRQQWQRYEQPVWQPLAKQAGLELVSAGGRCDVRLGALCANANDGYRDVWRWLFVLLAIFAAGGLAWAGWQRRRLRERQRFITQMLTHELRTPIAQLSNVVEHFRRDFDQLPDRAQLNFVALADTLQRMRQMAETSKHYLIAEHQREALEAPVRIRLSEWLDNLCATRDGLIYCLDEDMTVSVALYWSSLCLTNLLDNAFCHGAAPVRLTVRRSKTSLLFQVSDAGRMSKNPLLNSRRMRWSNNNLGLGLTIVQRVSRRLNGRLTFSASPTTFILELPCDVS